MYKREEEVDGMVVDPLKALHQVNINFGESGSQLKVRHRGNFQTSDT